MELINNTTKTLRDDLAVELKAGSRLSIAAACFSIYAFQELKAELQNIEELRFIFTSPTFTTKKAKKKSGNSIFLVLTVSAVFTARNLKSGCAMNCRRNPLQKSVRIGFVRKSHSNPMSPTRICRVLSIWTIRTICRSTDLRQ